MSRGQFRTSQTWILQGRGLPLPYPSPGGVHTLGHDLSFSIRHFFFGIRVAVAVQIFTVFWFYVVQFRVQNFIPRRFPLDVLSKLKVAK